MGWEWRWKYAAKETVCENQDATNRGREPCLCYSYLCNAAVSNWNNINAYIEYTVIIILVRHLDTGGVTLCPL